MEAITDLRVETCTSSRFIQLYRVNYKQDGRPLSWDYVVKHDSLSVLLYNKTKNCLVLVKQFRPAVLMHLIHQHEKGKEAASTSEKSEVESEPPSKQSRDEVSNSAASAATNNTVMAFDESPVPVSSACCYELCAGILDKNKTVLEMAKDEVLEECGFNVPESSFQLITSYQTGVGTNGSRQWLYYAEVTEDMRRSSGGGLYDEGEHIEVLELPVSDLDHFMYDENIPKTSSLLFAFMWFKEKHKSEP